MKKRWSCPAEIRSSTEPAAITTLAGAATARLTESGRTTRLASGERQGEQDQEDHDVQRLHFDHLSCGSGGPAGSDTADPPQRYMNVCPVCARHVREAGTQAFFLDSRQKHVGMTSQGYAHFVLCSWTLLAETSS